MQIVTRLTVNYIVGIERFTSPIIKYTLKHSHSVFHILFSHLFFVFLQQNCNQIVTN